MSCWDRFYLLSPAAPTGLGVQRPPSSRLPSLDGTHFTSMAGFRVHSLSIAAPTGGMVIDAMRACDRSPTAHINPPTTHTSPGMN